MTPRQEIAKMAKITASIEALQRAYGDRAASESLRHAKDAMIEALRRAENDL
jgi:hypothetical protein